MLAGIYEKMMTKPVERIPKDVATTHMTAEEARDYELVDQIFSKEMRTSQSALA
jgi:ATP-dependent protease ClpP protease subunit